jgi:hypothetical protein
MTLRPTTIWLRAKVLLRGRCIANAPFSFHEGDDIEDFLRGLEGLRALDLAVETEAGVDEDGAVGVRGWNACFAAGRNSVYFRLSTATFTLLRRDSRTKLFPHSSGGTA